MLTKIKIDDKAAREIVATISAGSKGMATAFEANRPAIAALAQNYIINQIEDIPTIGPFLAPRTRIDIVHSGSSIILTISGKTESEAGFPPVSGGTPSGEMSLWGWHEYGPYNPEGELKSYSKDVGGVKAERKTKAAGAGSKYKGVVRETVASLTMQLNMALQAVSAQAAHNIAATVIETGSRGKVQIPRAARKAMASAGISPSYLAALGVIKAGVTKTGQIYVIGRQESGGIGFMPSKALGIPTTIKTG